MALQTLLPRAIRTKGVKYTSPPVDVSGCRSFFMRLDVADGNWGTRNPATVAPPDYNWGMEVSYDDFATIFGVTPSNGCIGGRVKDGSLPSFELIAKDNAIQPAGTKLRVYCTALTQNISMGIIGEART